MVIMVTVVGGGVLLSSAAIKNVADKECEGFISAWQSGEVYGDIADNKEGAIEKAQKCKEAVEKAAKVAKANAALLGRASNISSSGAEMIATEFVNIAMDYVENAADPNYIGPTKDNKLPEIIKKDGPEEPKIDDTLPIEAKTEKEDVAVNDKECEIGIPDNSAPKVLLICDRDNMGFWYADRDGDIDKISMRFQFSYPEFDGYQEFDWQTAKFEYNGNDPYCGFQPALTFDHPEAPAGYRAVITVDIMLEDSNGNKSNISSCTI